ncbi:MAG: hypothetical protein MK137_09120 [Rickettsiales bacterium]|nr:hypothetical protein [Rickettsiales bacterium]
MRQSSRQPNDNTNQSRRNIDDLLPRAQLIHGTEPVQATPVTNNLRNKFRNLTKKPERIEATVVSGPIHRVEQNNNETPATDTQKDNLRNGLRNLLRRDKQRTVDNYTGLRPERLNAALTRVLGQSPQDRARDIRTARQEYHAQRAREFRNGGHVQRLQRQDSQSSQSSGYSVGYY